MSGRSPSQRSPFRSCKDRKSGFADGNHTAIVGKRGRCSLSDNVRAEGPDEIVLSLQPGRVDYRLARQTIGQPGQMLHQDIFAHPTGEAVRATYYHAVARDEIGKPV